VRLSCLVPARGGSQRLPRKNIAPLRGRPLLAWTVEAARASALFPEVWVSTDDAEIAAVARGAGAVVHDRPAALAGSDSTLVQVALDFADWLGARGQAPDVLCVLLPTAALVRPDDLRGGLARLRERDADFAMAVTSFLEPPFWALTEEDGYLRLFFGQEFARKSQALPPVQVDSGYFYFVRVEALRAERTLYGKRLVGYPIARERSIDIDEPVHLAIAEALAAAAERPADGGRG
jgi:N-acylneuraminate cytidylyltransferase